MSGLRYIEFEPIDACLPMRQIPFPKLLLTLALIAALALAATVFLGYQQPALLLDMLNLRYCG